VPREEHFIVATAGHVDHGKSVLIRWMTGTDPDRLPEEKARGITIDLGFAHLTLTSAQPGGPGFHLGIVDVPGHEDFVKNMVAGVGSVDLALLVVAADDGWMPQTEEHFQILSYLAADRAVIALTKSDLADDVQASIQAIRDRVAGTRFAEAPVVPVSVVAGRGLGELKAAMWQVLAGTVPPQDLGKPRLPVDRVFTVKGVGTVVTGTLTGGLFRRGQPVAIQPSGKLARIRNIQSHNREVDASLPGTRTALNLPDLAVEDLRRGDVITLPALGAPGETVDALVEISPRANHRLKDGARVHLHYGSGHVGARIAFFDRKQLASGERGLAQLRLEGPAFTFAGDRAVLRDAGELKTLAGVTVLDPTADRGRFRDPARISFLLARAESPAAVQPYVVTQLARDQVANRSELLANSRFSAAQIQECVSQLERQGKLLNAGDFVIQTEAWKSWRESGARAIDDFHHAHREQGGMSLREFRAALSPLLPKAGLFELLVADLCRNGFWSDAGVIRRAAHRPALSETLEAECARLRAILAAQPYDPPSRQTLTRNNLAEQALRYLIETGEVTAINAELVLATAAVSRAVEMTRQFLRAHGPATVSELRSMLGGSRRVVIPLLERLDRDGVTLRDKDRRSLHR